MINVLPYKDPDLDGVACAYAYSEFLNKTGVDSKPAFFGEPHIEALFILSEFDIKIDNAENLDLEKIILVDTTILENVDSKLNRKQVVEIIDHHSMNELDKFEGLKTKIQLELVGAAATLVAERFFENNINMSKKSAALLYLAIISNTLNLKANVTTERDKKMAKILFEMSGLESDFSHKMFAHKSQLQGTVFELLDGDSYVIDILSKKLLYAQLEIIDLENFVNKNLEDIKSFLQSIKKQQVDFVFFSGIDLEKGFNIFVMIDDETKELLNNLFDLEEKENYLKRDGVILRKEVMPMIKEYIDRLS
jgi:manganese-dependent inorganic pyrophosphatase